MPRVKIVILSLQGNSTEMDKIRIIDKLLKGIEYQITELQEQDIQLTANLIHEGHYDVVICSEDTMLSQWQLSERCAQLDPSGKRPVFCIDGTVENILDREFSHTSFSGAVGVVKQDPTHHSTFKFEKAYGFANEGIPNEMSTRFNIGSNTKMLTSIAIAKLIEEGGLELDTPIHDSLASIECDPFYKKVFAAIPKTTPRELLSHTSGLTDRLGKIFENDLGSQVIGFSKVRDYVEQFTTFNKELPLDAHTFNYCNFGYDLLGLAIEAINKDYYAYLKNKVLDIAGMVHTEPQRAPGSAFAVPYMESSPGLMPVLAIQSQDSEIVPLVEKAHALLKYAEGFSKYIDDMNSLITEYHRGLQECPPNQFDAFKAVIAERIAPILSALKEPLEAIGKVGLPLHQKIMEIETKSPKDPRLSFLSKLDTFYFQLYEYLSPTPLMGVLNSLSIASPSGRNMYSTVDDMLQFAEALHSGALSACSQHLTIQTAPISSDNPSRRYGFGCFITGGEQELQYTIEHGGDAPGMHAAFQMYPNAGFTVVTLANNDAAPQEMAKRVEKFLIFGEKQSVLYFDQSINPDVTLLLQEALTERIGSLELSRSESSASEAKPTAEIKEDTALTEKTINKSSLAKTSEAGYFASTHSSRQKQREKFHQVESTKKSWK